MNFKEFENNYRLIGYYEHSKDEVIKELLGLNSEDRGKLFDSFAKELNFNFLEKNEKVAKEDLLRYYLTHLRQLQHFFNDCEGINNKKNKLEFDLYKEVALVVYVEMFNDLQLACITNQLEFYKLCNEVRINYISFDCSITGVHLENIGIKEITKTLDELSQPRKLSLAQIALIYAYNNESITNDNKNVIAEKYGHKSGHKLYQHFNYYHYPTNRKGDEGSIQKNKNKIKLIESVIELILIDQKQRALDEVGILKRILKSEFI